MTPPRWPVVLFDLDGTLTDPQIGITRCIAHALGAVGQPVEDPRTLRPLIGPPLIEAFTLLDVPASRIDEAIAAYRERFVNVGMFENALIDGVNALLQELGRIGVRLAIATSKPEPFARAIVEHFGIDDAFEVVAGATLDNRRRHKEDVIEHAIESLGYPDPATIVMIGDREHDIHGARAHGLTSIGVLWGYGSAGELRDASADHIVATVDELAALLLSR